MAKAQLVTQQWTPEEMEEYMKKFEKNRSAHIRRASMIAEGKNFKDNNLPGHSLIEASHRRWGKEKQQ